MSVLMNVLFAAAFHQPDIATSRSECSRVSSQLLSAVLPHDRCIVCHVTSFPAISSTYTSTFACRFSEAAPTACWQASAPMPHLCDYGPHQSGHSARTLHPDRHVCRVHQPRRPFQSCLLKWWTSTVGRRAGPFLRAIYSQTCVTLSGGLHPPLQFVTAGGKRLKR